MNLKINKCSIYGMHCDIWKSKYGKKEKLFNNRYYTKEYFRNITNGYYYQIHDNLKDRLNDVKFPIVRTTNGYSALQNIDNDELTIISPFNPDMYMIHSMYEIE